MEDDDDDIFKDLFIVDLEIIRFRLKQLALFATMIC